MSKFLTASDGKIPFLQILIGIIVGAIGMFIYAKFWKPNMLFESTESNSDKITASNSHQTLPAARQPSPGQSPAPQLPHPSQMQQQHTAPQQQHSKRHPSTVIPTGDAQAYIEIQQIPMPSMPPLATIYEAGDEYSQDPEEVTEDDEQGYEEQGYPRQ